MNVNTTINEIEFKLKEFTNSERVAFQYWTLRKDYKLLEEKVTEISVKLKRLEGKLHPKARRLAEEINEIKAKLPDLKGKKLEDAELKIWELEQETLSYEDNVTSVLIEKATLEEESIFVQSELAIELSKFVWFVKFDFDFETANESLFRNNNVITYEETPELTNWLAGFTADDYAKVINVVSMGKHLAVIQKAIQKLAQLSPMQPQQAFKTESMSKSQPQEQQE